MTLKRTIQTAALIGVFLIGCIHLQTNAQTSTDLRINEILQYNDSNLQDDYGKHNPWIEIFNSSYSTLSLEGLFLTNDINNLTKYPIPKLDPRLVIPPRNYLIFWADSNTNHGVFHLNFHFHNSSFLALVDANGKTIIDSLSIRNQQPDVTWGRINDGEPEWAYLDKSTPNSTNFTGYIEPPSEKFRKVDPTGFGMSMIAMTVVFLSLILLYLVFKSTARAFSIEGKKRSLIKQGKVDEAKALPTDTSGEINAAIVMGLHLYMSELHDHEQTVLTIKKISRTYSPWSSKIYGLRRSPR